MSRIKGIAPSLDFEGLIRDDGLKHQFSFHQLLLDVSEHLLVKTNVLSFKIYLKIIRFINLITDCVSLLNFFLTLHYKAFLR